MSSASDRRNRHNLYTLTGALLASFAVVLVVVILAIRPEPSTRPEVDWNGVHASAPNASQLVNPAFTEQDGDWWSNRAEYIGGPDAQWILGFVTPSGEFVSIKQFAGSVPVDVAELLDDVDGRTRTIAGTTWTVYDRSALENPGNDVVVFEQTLLSGDTLIVSGTAADAELVLAAERALDSVKGLP